MASVNKALIIGNLGKDPEIRYLPSGDAICNFSVATADSWKDQNGEKQEKTEWHRISIFGKLAEIAGKYLKKGSQVYLEGRLQTRKWTDKEGKDQYTTEIVADRMQMLGARSGEGRGNDSSGPASSGQRSGGDGSMPHQSGADQEFDDIPFITCDFNRDTTLRKLANRVRVA